MVPIYNYDPVTREFLYESQADWDPEEPILTPLLPANATWDAPPAALDGYARVWDPIANRWVQTPDHRGEIWYPPTGEQVTIEVLGQEPDPTWTTTEPPRPWSEQLSEAENMIDNEAGIARSRFVANGTLIDQEYKLAEEQAKAYQAAYAVDPMAIVPLCVQSWASASGMTAIDAANDITSTAAILYSKLEQIRGERLAGKAACRAITPADPLVPTAEDSAAMEAAKSNAVTALRAIVP